LGGREGIQPGKKPCGEVLVWLSAWVRWRFAYSPANAVATPPINPDWFYLSGASSPR